MDELRELIFFILLNNIVIGAVVEFLYPIQKKLLKKVIGLLCAVSGKRGTAKSALLVRPWLATRGFTGCVRRLGAALRTREKRPSVSDPTERPRPPPRQRPPKVDDFAAFGPCRQGQEAAGQPRRRRLLRDGHGRGQAQGAQVEGQVWQGEGNGTREGEAEQGRVGRVR